MADHDPTGPPVETDPQDALYLSGQVHFLQGVLHTTWRRSMTLGDRFAAVVGDAPGPVLAVWDEFRHFHEHLTDRAAEQYGCGVRRPTWLDDPGRHRAPASEVFRGDPR